MLKDYEQNRLVTLSICHVNLIQIIIIIIKNKKDYRSGIHVKNKQTSKQTRSQNDMVWGHCY